MWNTKQGKPTPKFFKAWAVVATKRGTSPEQVERNIYYNGLREWVRATGSRAMPQDYKWAHWEVDSAARENAKRGSVVTCYAVVFYDPNAPLPGPKLTGKELLHAG